MKGGDIDIKNNFVLIIILALLVGGAAGFFGGMQYQKNQRSAAFGQFTNGQFGARGGSSTAGLRGRNGNGAEGTILSTDDNSMTVKLADGSSKIVLLTASTSFNKATAATAADLIVGQTVAAFGTTNTDGSITASNVQINPVMRGPGGPSGASGPVTP
jgi:hypothetical protein